MNVTAMARDALDWAFDKSIRENSVSDPLEPCVVTRLTESPPSTGDEQRQLVVLNMSSYVFRVVALFDFSMDAATRAHLAKLSRTPLARLDGQALLDACSEWVNMICGAVNRGLSARFPHAGMSTPFPLESSCAHHLSLLNPAWTRVFAVEINQSVRYNLNVCVCVASGSTLDFDLDRSAQEDASSGELELF